LSEAGPTKAKTASRRAALIGGTTTTETPVDVSTAK
jgi:hypothetical protein